MAEPKEIKILDLPENTIIGQDYLLFVNPDGRHNKGRAQDIIDSVKEDVENDLPRGGWNVSTNSPTLTATPDPAFKDGAYYDITPNSGNLPFGGLNFSTGQAVNVGDVLKKVGTQWEWVKRSDLALQKVNALEILVNALYKVLAINYQDDKFVVSDPDGNVFFEVTTEGINWIGRAEELAYLSQVASLLNLIISNSPEKISFSDPDGNEFFRCDPSGINWIGKTEADAVVTGLVKQLTPTPIFQSDYVLFLVYGQSLSVNGNSTVATDFFDAKTFTGGVLTNYDPDVAGEADAYFGSSLISLPTTGPDSGKGLVRIVKQLLLAENSISVADQDFTTIVSSAGAGGLSNSALMASGGDYYRRLLESVRRAKDFAIAQGKSFSVPTLSYIQGETDRANSLTDWYNILDASFTKLNTDIKAITGQLEDVQFIVYQIASGMSSGTGVPLAFLKLAKDKPNVHFGTAMYQYTYTDALHVDNTSTRIMHATMGVVAKRAVVDKKKMEPIGVKSYSIQKNEANTSWLLRLKMEVPVKPLVFDESINPLFVTPPTRKGFEIKNGSDVNIITGVSIVHGDTINILCSQNPVGLNLTYAIGGRDSGGNLRDSQGDKITVPWADTNKRVDNWCPMFSMVV